MKTLAKKTLKPLPAIKRSSVDDSQQQFVKAELFYPDKSLPLVIRPAVAGVDLVAWARKNLETIDEHLLKHGAILFRDFGIKAADEFGQFSQAVCSQLLEYNERSSPRTQVTGSVYTSTDYPSERTIFLHNENSYQHSWPLKILFFCLTPAQTGGETPIADCRNVFRRIDPEIRERFIEKKWMYVRNFGEGFGLPWQKVFQTTDRKSVEDYCRKNQIEVEWKDGDRLRTSAVRPAVATHPRSGEMTWFNHATFFNILTREPLLRETLLKSFGPRDLPTNTFYGDGSEIEPPVLAALQEAYGAETVACPWRAGDILLLDNMLAAHGRNPFTGPRTILVSMGEATGASNA